MVWCPTRSKDLGQSLNKQEPAKNETHICYCSAVQSTAYQKLPRLAKTKVLHGLIDCDMKTMPAAVHWSVLDFWKSIWKNQVWRTGFLASFELDFYF